MRIFTKEELKKYDGSDGITYIACYGNVYNVSTSYHWRKGVHHVTHRAGHELSAALEKAPHGFDLLKKFPIVGKLVESEPIQH